MEFGFTGEVLEVVPHAKIVHTQAFDPGNMGIAMGGEPSIITVAFHESDGITNVATSIKYASKADRDQAVATGMTDGMEDELHAARRSIKCRSPHVSRLRRSRNRWHVLLCLNGVTLKSNDSLAHARAAATFGTQSRKDKEAKIGERIWILLSIKRQRRSR